MNIDYSQFYRGTTNIPSYGSGAYKKDTLVKYEFNTTGHPFTVWGQRYRGIFGRRHGGPCGGQEGLDGAGR